MPTKMARNVVPGDVISTDALWRRVDKVEPGKGAFSKTKLVLSDGVESIRVAPWYPVEYRKEEPGCTKQITRDCERGFVS